jgi:hypothetical protein
MACLRDKKNHAGEDMVKQEPLYLFLGMQISTSIVESSMEFLKKLKIELSYDPVILPLGIYPKEQ